MMKTWRWSKLETLKDTVITVNYIHNLIKELKLHYSCKMKLLKLKRRFNKAGNTFRDDSVCETEQLRRSSRHFKHI